MTVRVEPIKPAIGAVVHVDRSMLCEESTVRAVEAAIERHSVLVFPRLNLTDEEQLAFTDKLGTRVNYAQKISDADEPAQDVYRVSFEAALNNRKEFVQGTFFWHIDGVMVDAPISRLTLLSGRTLSEQGGQTEFASLYAAYEALSEAEKQRLEELRAVHSLAPSMKLIVDSPTEEQMNGWNSGSRSIRPIVWRHKSGRKSLVVGYSADRVQGMPVADGRALLMSLVEWAAQPAFRYTHQWQVGDLVVWDNTAVMHRVVPYDEKSGRSMHRTSIAGTELIA